LKDNCVPDSELRWIYYLKQGSVCTCIIQLLTILTNDIRAFQIDADLGFYYVETTIRYYGAERLLELKSFLSGAALRFNCRYLAVPTKYFEDDQHFYLVFDNQFEELITYIRSIPVEEFNEKLVIKLVTQLIHAIQYLNDRNFYLVTRNGGIDLGIKRTLYGDVSILILIWTSFLQSQNVKTDPTANYQLHVRC
jgi:hypothetical protein